MQTIGSYEAKTHLPKLIDKVLKGEKITITRHGVPVAILQSPEAETKKDPKKVIAKLKQFRKSHTLQDLTIKEMIEQGRR